MIKTSYQTPELRDANDNVVQEGAFGKNTALSNSTNDGWIDYVMNDLEALHDTIGDSAPTLDGNGHVVEPANLAIGDEDGVRLKTGYLKTSGGTVSGTLNIAQNLKMQDNQENVFGGMYVPASSATSQFLQIYGGETPSNNGGNLQLPSDGSWTLQAKNGTTAYNLVGGTDGTLKWRGNNVAVTASPAFTGTPTAPTQSASDNSTRLATTAFCKNNFLQLSGGTLTGTTVIKSNANRYFGVLNSDFTRGNNPDATTVIGKFVVGDTNSASVWLSQATVFPNGDVWNQFTVYKNQTSNNAFSVLMKFPASGDTSFGPGVNNGTLLGEENNRWKCVYGNLGNFINDVTVSSSNGAKHFKVENTSLTRGTSPSSNSTAGQYDFTDGNGNHFGILKSNLYSTGETSMQISTYKNQEATSIVSVLLQYPLSGDPSFMPGNTNLIALGAANALWKQLYAGTTTISTSDERLKDNITAIPDAVLDAWGDVNWYQYQFKDSIEEKGSTKARIHTGAIAQRIESVFNAHGLDANKYGLLCYDEWKAEPAERDEDGNIVQPAQPAGNRYSLRYEEALCMEAAYQRRRADRLEERIARLEALISE